MIDPFYKLAIILNPLDVSREFTILMLSLIADRYKREKQSQVLDLKSARPTELLRRPLPGHLLPAVICTGDKRRGAALILFSFLSPPFVILNIQEVLHLVLFVLN